MSTESLAMFRGQPGADMAALAEQHLQHDLQQSDRDNLKAAASAVKTGVNWGSAIGVSLGLLLAFRLRTGRRRIVNAIRAADRPTHVRFADGREQAIPDFTPALKASPLGDIATYTFLGLGGLFFGGEGGLLVGTYRAKGFVTSDPESSKRIQQAFRNFQADALRKQAELLEQASKEGKPFGTSSSEKWL